MITHLSNFSFCVDSAFYSEDDDIDCCPNYPKRPLVSCLFKIIKCPYKQATCITLN